MVTTSASVHATHGTTDYYEVLGVEPDASVDDIKQAFRRKAREMHPDVNREVSRLSCWCQTDERALYHITHMRQCMD